MIDYSRVWKCSPFAEGEAPAVELFVCAPCSTDKNPDCFLYFDMSIGVCNWDYNVDCTNSAPTPTLPPKTTTKTTTKTTPTTTTTADVEVFIILLGIYLF